MPKQLLYCGLTGLLLATALCSLAAAGQDDDKLDVYFIDVEGGAATLLVTPAGEAVLVDTGNRGDRDPDRIVAAAQAAGILRIDHLIITHYHADHYGGLAQLSTLIPIQHLHDNADESPTSDRPPPEYFQARVGDRALMNPGDVLPLKQRENSPPLTIQCLAAHKKLIDPPAGTSRIRSTKTQSQKQRISATMQIALCSWCASESSNSLTPAT